MTVLFLGYTDMLYVRLAAECSKQQNTLHPLSNEG